MDVRAGQDPFVDSHCHVDRYPHPLEVLAAAEAKKVLTVAVTETPSSFQRLALRLGKRKFVRPALGIHPLRASSLGPLELSLFATQLERVDYVGEVGLDGSREGSPTLAAQVRVFEELLTMAGIRSKVLTVHSRGAAKEVIDRLAQAEVTAILHWFSDSVKLVDEALEAGLFFSMNPAMLTSKNGQRIIAAIPDDRIVTETDGPYTRLGGRIAQPGDVPALVAQLASLRGTDGAAMRAQIASNMVSARARAAS
jgi:TatD DNase family protein